MPVGDVAALAVAAIALLKDPEARKRLVRSGWSGCTKTRPTEAGDESKSKFADAGNYGLFLTISYGYELFPIFTQQLSKLQRTVGDTDIKTARRG